MLGVLGKVHQAKQGTSWKTYERKLFMDYNNLEKVSECRLKDMKILSGGLAKCVEKFKKILFLREHSELACRVSNLENNGLWEERCVHA